MARKHRAGNASASRSRAPFIVLSALVGAGSGVVLGATGLLDQLEAGEVSQRLLRLTALVVALIPMAALQIAAHEAGHLVCGLLSGYGFVSYRVGSLMLVRHEGRLALRRLKLAGTGGQCVMEPPGELGDRIPTTLYNLGGSLANLLLVGLSWVALRHTTSLAVGIVAWDCFAVGLFMALTNGIPLNLGEVPNDGWNALHLCRSEAARHAFWVELKMSALSYQGVRLRDMPAAWFEMPGPEAAGDALAESLGVFVENWHVDRHDFEAAEACLAELLRDDATVAGLYRALLLCDQAYCALLREGAAADVSYLDEGQAAPILKQMGDYPSVLRTRYAVALIKQGDQMEAQRLEARFERVAASYPAPAEIAGERELMELVRSR